MSKSQKGEYPFGNKSLPKRINCIPENYITQVNFDELRPIARRQFYSLLKRRKLTKKHSLYDREIIKLLQYEKGVKI